MNLLEINVLVLAYLGDTVYENYVRKFLINKGIAYVDQLQKEAVSYVSAKGQAFFLQKKQSAKIPKKNEICNFFFLRFECLFYDL